MIKVVRKQKKRECPCCRAVLKFEREAVEVEYDSNGRVVSSWIVCPICRDKVWLA